MMKAQYCFFILASAFFHDTNCQGSWPEGKNLVGFWPLTNYYKLRDLSGNKLDGTALADSYSSTLVGPFGDPLTSYTTKSAKSQGGVFSITDKESAAKLSLKGLKSFTISFFLRNPGNNAGGFLQFLNADGKTNSNPLALYVRYSHLCLAGSGSSGCKDYTDVFNLKVWNYLALRVVADGQGTEQNCSVTVYNRFGRMTKPRIYPFICKSQDYSVGGIRLGGSSQGSQSWNPNLLVSCLMIYNTAVSEQVIIQNYESCRLALSGAPCGAPRLPISPIPQVSIIPARAGQFPWIASLRFKATNKPACAATIINPYWLLTTTTCFATSSEPSNYYVLVGDFDLSVTETFEKKHQIQKIIVKPKTYKELSDVALIELTESIDFSNAYVNEACIPADDSSFFQPDATAFVIGWGLNGRHSIALTTTIRYGIGHITANGDCATSWGETGKEGEPVFCFLGDPDPSLPCDDDNGSPLGMLVNSKLVQAGVYSTRNKNCSETTSQLPIFTRVSGVWPWIQSQLVCANPGLVYPVECPRP